MRKSIEVKIVETSSDLRLVHFKSISELDGIKHLFGSKEWITSYVLVYNIKKIIILDTKGKNPVDRFIIGLQKSSQDSNILVPIGTPYNDYNYLPSDNYTLAKLAISGFEELLRMGYEIDVDLLFDTRGIHQFAKLVKSSGGKFNIRQSQMSSVYCEYLGDSKKYSIISQRFSKKLLKQIKRHLASKRLDIKIIRGTDLGFRRSLERLLYHRRINFFSLNKEDVISAFSPTFDKFILTLTSRVPIRSRCCVYELFCNGRYAASDLFFYETGMYLCYLRACNRRLSKISPGMVLTYLSHIDLVKKYRKLIIDYTRGDEPYKFRIGGKNQRLYRMFS